MQTVKQVIITITIHIFLSCYIVINSAVVFQYSMKNVCDGLTECLLTVCMKRHMMLFQRNVAIGFLSLFVKGCWLIGTVQ